MALKLSVAARNGMCNTLVDRIDNGTAAGTLKFYTGTQPTDPDTALSGNTLLATLTFSDPAFGNAASGTATASAITDDSSADATGTVTFFRIEDSAPIAEIDGAVSTSGAEINFNTTSWTAGDAVSVTSLTITQPQG